MRQCRRILAYSFQERVDRSSAHHFLFARRTTTTICTQAFCRGASFRPARRRVILRSVAKVGPHPYSGTAAAAALAY